MKLVDLKIQALRYLALGEHDRALLVYHHLIRQLPDDLDVRMNVADVLVQAGLPHLACRVYAAVAWCDLQAGRPLHALVCCQALSDLGQAVGPSIGSIHESLAERYGAGSQRLRRGDGPHRRYAHPDPDTEVAPPEFLDVSPAVAAEVTAEVAADTATFTILPTTYLPVPLLSDLHGAAFAQLSQAALIRRVGPGTVLFQQGAPSFSVFWIASGSVDIVQEAHPAVPGDGPEARAEAKVELRAPEGTPRTLLARLGEGAILGELGLLSSRQKAATAETSEPSDLIELPVKVLRAVAQSGDAAAAAAATAAIDRFCRERLLRVLSQEGLLFRPFTPGQRIELLRRVTVHEVEADTILLREGQVCDGLYVIQGGQVEVSKGAEPFEVVEGRWSAGDMGCEAWLLRPTPAPVTLRATERSTVLLLPREAFQRFCHTVPAAQKEIERLAVQHARELNWLGRSVLPDGAARSAAVNDREARSAAVNDGQHVPAQVGDGEDAPLL